MGERGKVLVKEASHPPHGVLWDVSTISSTDNVNYYIVNPLVSNWQQMGCLPRFLALGTAQIKPAADPS